MIKKILLVSAGSLCLVLGAIGVFLPVLPTTPFVLLSAACFGASSKKLYARLCRNRYFGQVVRSYREKTGISPATKWRALLALWLALALSGTLAGRWFVWLILLAVGICVSIHLAFMGRMYNRRKTAKPAQNATAKIHSENNV